MRQNSILTETHRNYLRGESKISEGSDHERKTRERIRERLIAGIGDFELLAKSMSESDIRQIFRQENFKEDAFALDMETILSFLMEASLSFNFGMDDWEVWMKRAYEKLHPDGFADITIEATPEIDVLGILDRHADEDGDLSLDKISQVEWLALQESDFVEVDTYVETKLR